MMAHEKGDLKNELVIAHRGLSSIFPENSLAALKAALMCSNYAEMDLQLTKDGKVIVFHDRGLKRITNVADFCEFADRNKSQAMNKATETVDDFWVRDFTLQQLKKLTIIQDNPKRPQLRSHSFPIITFEQLLQQYIEMRNRYASECGGLLVEIKEQVANLLTDNDRLLCMEIGRLLRKYQLHTETSAIILQSFQIETLNLVTTDNLRVQLYHADVQLSEQLLSSKWRPNVIGIGITEQNLLKSPKFAQNNLRVKQLCDKLNYKILYWTVINDKLDSIPMQRKNYREVYEKLREEGVTGFITEFPLHYHQYFGQAVELSDILEKCQLAYFGAELENCYEAIAMGNCSEEVAIKN